MKYKTIYIGRDMNEDMLDGFVWFRGSWEDKGVHTFPKGICLKVNIIARLEYELAYYDSAVHRFNHYTTRTPPRHVGGNKQK